jgi:CRISPR/Cas system-associated exonuclease Cas4 (RecB family)
MKYKPYSFSKINCFKTCPKQFEFTYVNKIAPDDTYTDPIFFQRGRFVHEYIAHRLSGGAGELYGFDSLPVEDKMNLIDNANETLNNDYVSMTFNYDVTKIENEIRFDENLLPGNDYSWGADHTVTGKVDYYAVDGNLGCIIDWKSGNYQDTSNFDQLELYAVWLFQNFPKITEVDLLFYYVEHQKFNIKTVTIEDVIKFRNKLGNSIELIENTVDFDVTPSPSCKYCKFLNTCRTDGNINY